VTQKSPECQLLAVRNRMCIKHRYVDKSFRL
jgi:hypothetical protein